MEANDREELIEKIIKEQDLVCIYICNDTNKSLDWNAKYYNNLGYGEIIDIIIENPEIIDSFSMKNLYTLLASRNNKEILEKINKRISEKLENEDFFCEDIEMAQFFLSSTEHTYANYYRIDEDLRKMIGKKIEDELKNFRGTEYDRIDKALREYPDAANFLKYYKDGIFTPEKIETINQMIEKSPDALRYVNFGSSSIQNVSTSSFSQNLQNMVSTEPNLEHDTNYCLGVNIGDELNYTYKTKLEERYNNSDPEVRQVFDMYSRRIRVQNTNYSGRNLYNSTDTIENPRGIYYNINQDMNNEMGAGTDFFYASGLMIDNMATGYRGNLSDSREFQEALNADGVLNGISNNLNESQMAQLRTTFFGHFFEASMGNGERLQILRNEYPRTYQAFRNIIHEEINSDEMIR